jgi:hypothetical protein
LGAFGSVGKIPGNTWKYTAKAKKAKKEGEKERRRKEEISPKNFFAFFAFAVKNSRLRPMAACAPALPQIPKNTPQRRKRRKRRKRKERRRKEGGSPKNFFAFAVKNSWLRSMAACAPALPLLDLFNNPVGYLLTGA